jgi:hypothetical protein
MLTVHCLTCGEKEFVTVGLGQLSPEKLDGMLIDFDRYLICIHCGSIWLLKFLYDTIYNKEKKHAQL